MSRRRLVSIKDVCWILYLYPGRLSAKLFPGLLSALQPIGARLARWLARGERQRLTKRMRFAGYCDEDITAIVDQYFDRAVGRALCDLGLDHFSRRLSSGAVEVIGLEHVTAAREQGSGVLLVSGHFFASRLAKRWLRQQELPVLSVRHPVPPDPGIGVLGERWLQRQYIQFLNQAIGEEVMIDDPECTLKILRRLRSGGLVNIHVDAPFAKRTSAISFLGKEQSFSASFLRLAELSGARVIPFWFSGSHHRLRIVFESPVDYHGDPQESLVRIIRQLESQVLERPSDYELWIML